MSLTLKINGINIINDIEIDENNVIITGEMRWRAANLVFNDNKEINCKLILEINEKDRFKRQMIENLHHNLLDKKDRDQGIIKMWNTGDYKSQQELADQLGLSQFTINKIFRAHKIEIEHQIPHGEIPSRSLSSVDKLTKTDQKKVIKKILDDEVDKRDMDKVVREIKELPNDVKTEILKPKVKITPDKLKEAKEVSKMPTDVRKEVLKPKAEITIEEAKFVSDFPKTEQRKEVIKQIKQTKQATKRIIEREKKIVDKKEPIPIKAIINIDQKKVDKMMDIFHKIAIEYREEDLKQYNAKTQEKCIEIMRKAYKFIFDEVGKYGKRNID